MQYLVVNKVFMKTILLTFTCSVLLGYSQSSVSNDQKFRTSINNSCVNSKSILYIGKESSKDACSQANPGSHYSNGIDLAKFHVVHGISVVNLKSFEQSDYRQNVRTANGKFRLELVYYFMCNTKNTPFSCEITSDPLRDHIEVVANYLDKCDISLAKVHVIHFKTTSAYAKLSLKAMYQLFEALPRFQRIAIYYVDSVDKELAPEESGSEFYAGSIISRESPESLLDNRVLITKKGYKQNAGGLVAHELLCHILPNNGPHSKYKNDLCFPLVPVKQKSVTNCKSIINFGVESGFLTRN
ncbi:hypothetical protein ACFL17_08850 [Pseudomonadota bacterium]